MFSDLNFAHPHMLYLLAALPLLAIWKLFFSGNRPADILYVHASYLDGVKKSVRQRLRHLPLMLRLLAMALLIVALARPQTTSASREVSIEGIDIMIALDISGSMLAEDFRPNRMEAAKETAVEFIRMRKDDRIGATVFSGQSFTLCPLTTDHILLKELISQAGPGMVADGTAIGDGLATAINRLRESDAESKVIVLLTDGINNTGMIDPLTAAELAALKEIKVYTIGIGSNDPVPYPFETPFGVEYRNVEIPVDEILLRQIAEITDGRYFWAESQDALQQVYHEIDQLERTVLDIREYSRQHDQFLFLLLLGLVLLFMEASLRYTWLKTFP